MELDADQQKAYDTILERFDKYKSLLLPADCGYGKTRIAINMAVKLNLPTIVVCPKTVVPMWEKLLKEAGVKVLLICSYNKLLTTEYLDKNGKRYYPTKEWKRLTKKGMFIILDEAQNLKNVNSQRHRAFNGLLTNNYKMLHLTAAPIDKRETWVSLYQNMGIVTYDKMSGREKGQFAYKDFGLGQVFKYARLFNKQAVNDVKEIYTLKKKNIPEILSYLWVHVFRERLVIPVIDPIYKHNNVVLKKDRCNYFATLDTHGKKLLYEALADLGNAGIVKDNQINIAAAKRNFSVVQLAFMKCCHAKLNTVIRLAVNKLQEQNRKVIICCPFVNDQDILCQQLQDYGVLLLNGSTCKRDTLINQFNEPNNNYRVMVMTPEVGGEGVDLHDTHGDYPRTMFVIPTHAFLKMVQCGGRIYRRGLKSDTEVYFVYSNDGLIENVLINTLAKTEIAASVLIPGSGRQFPGSYEFQIEDDGPKYAKLKQQLEEEKII